jgi:flavin-binding protein dodecin
VALTTETNSSGMDGGCHEKDEKQCLQNHRTAGNQHRVVEDAAKNAVQTASRSLRELRRITKLDMAVDNGKVVAYRARVSLSFKYEK